MSGPEPVPAALLDSLGQAVVTTDLEGKIVFWNALAEQLYGWRKDEVLGRQSRELLSAPGAGRVTFVLSRRQR